MRSISVRQPVAAALLEKGIALIGKNWPAQYKLGTFPNVTGPVGIQVSTQGSDLDLHYQKALIQRWDLGRERFRINPWTPKGHVVAKAEVIGVWPGYRPVEETWKYVREMYAKHNVDDITEHWVRGWKCVFPEPRWLYVIAHVERVQPFKWRGVMSQFPVPDELFKPVGSNKASK